MFRPSTNGLNERLNGPLFDAIKIYASDKPSTWDQHLDAVTFAYRTTAHSVTKHTPAFFIFGRELDSPADVKPPMRLNSEDFVKRQQNERRQAYAVVKELLS